MNILCNGKRLLVPGAVQQLLVPAEVTVTVTMQLLLGQADVTVSLGIAVTVSSCVVCKSLLGRCCCSWRRRVQMEPSRRMVALSAVSNKNGPEGLTWAD